MNDQPAPFPEPTAITKVKRIIVAIAGEMMLAAGITLMALVVLVLFVFPGGVEVLAIEWGRAKHWMRKAGNLLSNTGPRRKQEAVSVSPDYIEVTRDAQGKYEFLLTLTSEKANLKIEEVVFKNNQAPSDKVPTWLKDLPIPVTSKRVPLSLTARRFLACMGSPTARGLPPKSQLRGRRCCLLFYRTRSAPRNITVSQLNTQPAVSPVNASRLPSRTEPRASLGAGAAG